MTKKFFMFAAMLMAVAAVTFTGCKKDEPKQTMTVTWTESDLQNIDLSEAGETYTAKGVTLTVIDGSVNGTSWKSGDRLGVYFNGRKENEPSFTFTTTEGKGKFCKIVMATGTYYNYDAEAWKLGDEGAVWTGYTDKVGFGPQFYSVEEIIFYIEK
ncbi:MAG: hypothetical protein J5884_01605 [Paludibacteraceae bacterium]|nr:hypothetical protein [Paludibacteraceae bacterium]MBO4454799.1 hypothetical protein [Paludibacteraceae bacterium]